MHRSIQVYVPSDQTDKIAGILREQKDVIGLSVLRGTSSKPPGDLLIIHVLNRGADKVLQAIIDIDRYGSFTVLTSELTSISNRYKQEQIDKDIDEAIWEEMETGLLHNGRITINFLLLMLLGGIVATIGFISDIQAQAIAFVAASIIAPGLEPIAKLPLGLALGRRKVLWEGLKATFTGYTVTMLSSAACFLALLSFGEASPEKFLSDRLLQSLLEPAPKDVVISFASAAAAIIMYLSYRRNVISGPLVTLILIPAASASGISLALARWDHLLIILERLGIDILIIVGMGVILVGLKQKFIHKRKTLRK